MKDVDILSDQIFAVMNLIEASVHSGESFVSDQNPDWLEYKIIIDEVRKKYMDDFIKHENNQKWCFSKHLLSSAMRLKEVGDKHLRNGETEEAKDCYYDSDKILEIFFNANFKEKSFLNKLKEKLNVSAEKDTA